MSDTTSQIDSAPPEIQNLRRYFTQYLQSGSGGMGQTGATASQPQNLFIGASQYQNPNAAFPSAGGGFGGPTPTPIQTNPITGQQPGTGPTFGAPTTPPPSTGITAPPPTSVGPTSPTPTPTPLPPSGGGSFLDAILTPKSKTPTGGFFPGSTTSSTGLSAPSPYSVSSGSPSTPPPTSVPVPTTASAPTSPYYRIDPGPSQAITVAPGARFIPYEQPLTVGAREVIQGMFQGSTLEYIPGRGIVAIPQGTAPMPQTTAPADTGGFTPGRTDEADSGFFSQNMNTVSPQVVQTPVGPGELPPYDGPPLPPGWQPPSNPTLPPEWTIPPVVPPIDWPGMPPAQPGGGGPVAPGGPTGTGAPTYPTTPTTPGSSPFDSMISQLPPEMQRIILGNPAMVDQARQALEKYTATQSQSVDQLGGANSAFFQNMMQQLAPAFNQRREEGLAAAKEASGNLTGSGYANALGSSINRSLGEEQATLANYAAQGLQTEVQRQLQQGGLDLSAMELGQRAELSNIATEMQRRGYNADQINKMILTQAGLDANRIQTLYTGALANNQFNAQQFLQGLLGLLGQKNDVAVQGGIGSVLGPIGSILPFLLA